MVACPIEPLDPASFRSAIGAFATGVAVITTEHAGRDYGVTVNSLTSISLHPLLLLVSLKHGSGSADAILQSGRFGVNILGADQEALSNRFVAKIGNRFDGVACDRSHSVPLIQGTVAAFVCRVERSVEAGDHTIILGQVLAGGARPAEPLLYHRGGYARLLKAA